MSKKYTVRNLIITGIILAGTYIAMQITAKKRIEPESIDDENPYLVSDFDCKYRDSDYERHSFPQPGIYETKVKPVLDRILAFIGLVLLSPLFVLIGLAIYVDDPGSIFFTQIRVGKDKHFFILHKFRSMRMSTPHDVPTHQLKNPEEYLTKIGKVLRKTSLDELPQIWDIFRGKMSIIGPRPALWNQSDLVEQRDFYGANSVMPGLTGLAQIKGRDELEIPAKAMLDGEYTRILREGGLKAVLQDVSSFFGTIVSVVRADGVIEGGTGKLQRKSNISADDAGFEEYGFKKKFIIDQSISNKKKVLITGVGSYVGESFKSYVEKYYSNNLCINTVDMTEKKWKNFDFSSYDCVFHVAGIAHADVGSVSKEKKKLYQKINTDLAIETARKCRAEGVKQFIFMSSMIVYGSSVSYGSKKIIDETTVPFPDNCYGDSKWQADKGVRSLNTDNFKVAVIRAPMIYGCGSKGNYPMLAKLSKCLPYFPDIDNSRSMIHVDNLCEFVSLLVLSGEGGVYFPQNEEYTKTSDMVKEISRVSGKNIHIGRLLNPAVTFGSKIPGKVGRMVDKAFGNFVYSQRLSTYDGLNYRVRTFRESIELTEKKAGSKSVLILVNHDVVIYNFRLELVKRLLADGYTVHISSPYGERIKDLISLGAFYHEISIERHGMNPIAEIAILNEYKRLINIVRPAVILAYTVKPNIYGGIAARVAHIPFIANVTGLGTSVENGGIKERFVLSLYRIGLFRAHKVFFQNEENKNFMLKRHIVISAYHVLPGSGVNLEQHCFEEYPNNTEELVFTTVGRIMKDKGIDEFLEAAGIIKGKYPKVQFRLIGFFDDDYQKKIENAVKSGIIKYIEQQRDIHPYMKESHAIIHPSYHEGMSNVLLEAAATGRPVLASNVPGCKETFEEGVSGLGFQARNSKELASVIEKFIRLPYKKKVEMGKAGRRKIEQEFDRRIVIEEYMREIEKIMEEQRNVRRTL